jgi:hypothetical protein
MDENLTSLGGFPKIFQCNKAELQIIQESKNREFTSVKSAVSIKDIMLKRLNTHKSS